MILYSIFFWKCGFLIKYIKVFNGKIYDNFIRFFLDFGFIIVNTTFLSAPQIFIRFISLVGYTLLRTIFIAVCFSNVCIYPLKHTVRILAVKTCLIFYYAYCVCVFLAISFGNLMLFVCFLNLGLEF